MLFHVAKHETNGYPGSVIKGQDILVLLKLVDEPQGWTVRSLAGAVGLDPASAHRALRRLGEARLVDLEGQRVNRANAEEFLIHGLKYLFPVRQDGLSRGMPTAWAAPPLADELTPTDEPPPVWPDPKGRVRGVALEPLHQNAPEIARREPELAKRLALIDAIRLGDGRVRSLATKHLAKSLRAGANRR
jgi:IclR helix-turn-helix domain.